MPVKQTQHFEKTIQALPVEAYGTPGDMYFKIYDRHGRLHFTSSNPCADQQQCWQRAEKIINQYWEGQNEND
jgi:hypothetical protein